MRLREVYAGNVKPGDVVGGEVGVSERRPFAEFAHALTVAAVDEIHREDGLRIGVKFTWSYGGESGVHRVGDKLVVIES